MNEWALLKAGTSEGGGHTTEAAAYMSIEPEYRNVIEDDVFKMPIATLTDTPPPPWGLSANGGTK
jgi:hypothetical protein